MKMTIQSGKPWRTLTKVGVPKMPMPSLAQTKLATPMLSVVGSAARRPHRIEIFLTGTDDMMADGFTKPVDKTKFLKCRDYILTKA